jgi:hypothetical protein
VEIAQHELLGEELAFRGGTCLHSSTRPGNWATAKTSTTFEARTLLSSRT